jgi:hypothetical protein
MGDAIQIKISAIDDFSQVVNKFRHEFETSLPAAVNESFSKLEKKLSSTRKEIAGIGESAKSLARNVNQGGDSLLDFGIKISKTINQVSGNSIKSFSSIFTKGLQIFKQGLGENGSITSLWENHWQGILSTSFAAISQIASGINSKIGNALNSAMQGFQAGAQFGMPVAIAGGIFAGVTTFFSGPTNEELMQQYGSEAGVAYGNAWSEAVQAKMWQMAEKLPKAASGKYDFVAAAFHPETMQVALQGLTEFGSQVQEQFSKMFENNVKPVLMNILGMSEAEAAQAMAPLFETTIAKALEYGQALSPTMERMLAWARELGVEINLSGEKFIDAFNNLIKNTNISVEQFANLRTLALQTGVDIDTTFSHALENFLTDSDFSIEKLEGIALAAREAGFNLETSFANSIAAARESISGLRAELQTLGENSLDWFLEKMSHRDRRKSYQKSFIDQNANEQLLRWQKENAAWLQRINSLSGQERTQALQAYDLEKQRAQGRSKEQAQERYNQLLERANSINIDGKHDIKDIREAIKDLPAEEKKVVLELAKQKQERLAHRQEMKRQKELQKKLKEQIKAQKDLIAGINKLAQGLSGNFVDMANNLPDTTKFAIDLNAASQSWKYMVEHPLNPSINFSGGSAISAANGVDLILSGPASGYQVPLTMHGTERMQITPASKSGTGSAYKGETINITQNLHLNTLDAASTEQWLRKTGLPLMARQIKTEITGFKRNIVKGDA